jgi:putative MATE family efflux protein
MEHIFDKGVTVRRFASYVTPSVIMLVFIALYYLIDAFFVANYVNSDALAAISIVYPISGFSWGVSIMLAAGSSAIVAMRMGEGNQQEANEKFSLICIFSVGLGVLFTVLGLVFFEELIELLGANETLKVYCMDYGWILILALPTAFLGVLLEYFIRVDGRPGFTLFLYVSGGIVHLVLDYLFLVCWGWGIEGAGWATAAGQLTVLLLGLIYFATQETKLKFVWPKWDLNYLKDSIVNGSSEMVSESSTAVTVYVFNRIVLKMAGEDGLAALSIVLNTQYLLISIHLGFITGVAPLISFYYGAKEYVKVNQFLRYSGVFVLVSSLCVSLLAILDAPLIAGAFAKPDTEVYHIAIVGIRFLSVAFLFNGINVFVSGFFTAYGNGVISALVAMSRGLIMVLIGALTLPHFFGINGVWMTVAFAEITTFALSAFMLRKYRSVYGYGLKRDIHEGIRDRN